LNQIANNRMMTRDGVVMIVWGSETFRPKVILRRSDVLAG
jgi:hypothetical protein